MKLNKFYIYAVTALTSLFAASCSDSDNEYAPGEWNASADYANVYFETASVSETVEPTDPTTTTVELHRRNTSGALTVPFKVLKNTDDVFTVGNAVFADGDDVATATISFPNAVIGTTYNLQITVDDPSLVSYYSEGITYSYTVLRAKWNLLGTGTLSDKFWFEDSWDVEIYQRDDDNSYYRIKDPFAAWAADLDGTQSEAWDFHVLKKGDKIGDVEMEDAGIIDWTEVNTGYRYTYNGIESHIHYSHPQTRASDAYHTYDLYKNNSVLEYLADGKTPGKIQMAPIFMMYEYGAGWNYTDDPQITITFPGYVEEYTATPEDYDWEAVFTGDYISAQLQSTTAGVTLYKGKRNADVEAANPGCYDRFEAQYGTAYRIEAPYAEGKDVYFSVRDNKVLVPKGYESQDLGFKAVGNDVYGRITAGESSFAETEVNLNMTFQNKAGTTEYGTATETLIYLTWTAVGTGTYTYTVTDYSQEGGLWEGSQAATLYACDQNASRFKIAPWANQTGEDGLVFTVDDEGTIVVNQAETGYVDEDWGMVYASDLITYGVANIPSYVEDGVYYFELAYHDYDAPWAYVEDTFTLDTSAAAAKKAAKGRPAAAGKHKRPNVTPSFASFNAKKVRQQRIDSRFAARKAVSGKLKAAGRTLQPAL